MSDSQQVRENLLLKGLGKPLALNAIDWKVKQQNPSATPSEVRDETLEAVRSLVDDGLFWLGDVYMDRFFGWKRPLDRSMNRISHQYVDHYDDPKRWMYSAWLKLTDKGERLALSLEEQAVDFYRELEATQPLSAGNAVRQLPVSVTEPPSELDDIARSVA
jgi:hypothetical protein